MGARRSRIEIDDLVKLRFPSSPVISPDGSRVVYVEKRAGLERNRYHHDLMLVDLATGKVQGLTAGDHSDTAPAWTPDSSALVFVSDRDGKQNLWLLHVDGGEAERLTNLDGPVSSPEVSPDGARVAFIHAPKTERQRTLEGGKNHPAPQFRHLTRLSYKLDGHGYWDDAWMHLWVLDLRTRRVRKLTSGSHHDGQHQWSPNGRYLAFVSNRIPRADLYTENSDIFVVRASGGSPRQLTRKRGPKYAPSWSVDGGSIAFIGHTRFPDTVENLHVWVVPLRGGGPRDLVPRADLMCANAAISDTKDVPEGSAPRPLWSADGRRVFFLASHAGCVNIFEVPSRGGAPVARSTGKHEIAEFSQSADGKRWAFVRIDATSPGDVYVATLAGGRRRAGATAGKSMVAGAQVERLTRINSAVLRGKHVQSPKEFEIRSRDGHHIHGWVLHAKGKAKRGPAVLMVHGGPYTMYAWSFFHEFQMLAAAGYHVFFTNIRGSVGYGNDFMRAIVGRWGHEDYKDVSTVADWIESRPYVDKQRVGIAGGSYGGFMTNWAVGHTRRFKCAITMRSVAHMASFYGASDMGWLFHQEFGTHPWEAHERYWRSSPIAFVELIRTPLLILHSDEDHRCPVSQAEELYVALKILNRDVEMVRFLGESHGLSRSGRPHNRLERLRRILDWFDRKL